MQTQVGQSDLPVEFAAILTGICLHINVFLEDLMVQYAQARPWILLQEGGDNTYVSSAMPQKRNPGLVNNCRTGIFFRDPAKLRPSSSALTISRAA